MQRSVAPFRFKTAVCQSIFIVMFALLAGCSGPLVKSAITSNIVQEEAHNAYLLLNIIRAQERMPMHFTQVNTVRAAPGGLGIGTPTLTLGAPFGGDALANFPLTSSVEMASSVDTASLVSQDFMRGITTPVDSRLMVYFANQGWPHAMVLHLFLGGIEAADSKGRVIYSVHNSPYDDHTFEIFADIVRGLDQCRPSVVDKKDYTLYGPVWREPYSGSLEHIAALKNAGMVPVEVDRDGEIPDSRKPSLDKTKYIRFGVVSKESMLAFTQTTRSPSDLASKPCQVRVDTSKYPHLQKLVDAFNSQNAALVNPEISNAPEMHVRFVMRSTQSMLYFLGELSRKGQRGILTIPVRGDREAALFVTKCCTRPLDAPIAVEYRSNHYSIDPRTTMVNGRRIEDRSLQTLALVSLVYGLQNQSGEAPAIRNVRVIP